MAPDRKYTDSDVHSALEEIRNGASISESARKYGIPRSTLSEKHSGRLPPEHRMGPPTVLSAEEESCLEKWIFYSADAGFPISKDQLLDSVQVLLNKSKRETVFTDNRPGRKWYEAFTKRHPLVVEREAQNLTSARANVTEDGLRGWYAEVKQYLSKTNHLDILDFPDRIFNMDESGFFLNPKPGKVLARRGQRRVYTKIQGDEKEMITALIGGNASGMQTPPLVMFPYQRLPSNIVKDMPENWAFGRSVTGWMTAEAFYEYVTNCFYPWLIKNNIVLPIILFVDGHASHVTYHLSEFCREKGIILIALHPNATHLIQPMDVSVFHSMKCHWHKAGQDYPKNNNGARITREKFAKVLKKVLDIDITPEIVANGFVRCGLYPFNPDAIDYGQLIKRQKINNQHDDRIGDIQHTGDNQSTQFLEQFECHLDEDVLLSFKNSDIQWTGRLEDTSLFEFWRKIGGCSCSQNSDVEITEVAVEFIDSSLECFQSGQIIEIITLDNTIETDVANDGSCIIESECTGSSVQGNNVDIETMTIANTETIGEISNATSDLSPTENTDVLDSDEQSFDELSSADEETDIDIACSSTHISDIPHIASGFPRHFQDALFWPGRKPEEKSERKRKPKEKIPAVLIAQDFIDYLKNKEEEKVRIEKEKAERKAEREMKKLEKQKQEEQKAKVMLERKLERQRKEEEKERQKAERQIEKEAKKIEKRKKEEEKEKVKAERKTKKSRKLAPVFGG